jgi:4-diphosphocytidyl-2-C-methyl-D-erythritol kinase
MVFFPNCKINLGLNITGKRPDGFHDLETVFYPIQIKDAVEIINDKNNQRSTHNVSCSISGLPIDGNTDDNLCVKAYRLLKKDFPDLPAVHIHLHKVIPMGAGLGGGSADGAFTLKLLNKKFDLGLPESVLFRYAMELGSDCPFFIINKPCFATGRGENLTPVNIDLTGYKFIVIHPGIHVDTRLAFSTIQPSKPARSINEIIHDPIGSFKEKLINDFEKSIFSKHPEIRKIKDELYKNGAIYASMTGSGSAVYGIFEKDKSTKISVPQHYFVRELVS